MLKSIVVLKIRSIYSQTLYKLRFFLVDTKLQHQKDTVQAEKKAIQDVKNQVNQLKLEIRNKENLKSRMKKKFEKSLISKTLGRIITAS